MNGIHLHRITIKQKKRNVKSYGKLCVITQKPLRLHEKGGNFQMCDVFLVYNATSYRYHIFYIMMFVQVWNNSEENFILSTIGCVEK